METMPESHDSLELERKETIMSYPDITLTGEEIHNAFCVVDPDNAIPWDKVPKLVKTKYDGLAKELRRDLDARLAWFEGDEERTITAIKCPSCGAMIADLRKHPCLER
jgi:hypothetical protein